MCDAHYRNQLFYSHTFLLHHVGCHEDYMKVMEDVRVQGQQFAHGKLQTKLCRYYDVVPWKDAFAEGQHLGLAKAGRLFRNVGSLGVVSILTHFWSN